MWSNLGDRLAGLGDALTERASSYAKQQHDQDKNKDNAATAPSDGTAANLPPSAAEDVSSFAPVNLDTTAPTTNAPTSTSPQNQQSTESSHPVPRWSLTQQNQAAMLGSLRNWTASAMEVTKHVVTDVRETLEKEQARIQASAPSLFHRPGVPYRRDPSLPLDVEALRDAEVVYITDRIVTLSHPYMQSTTDGDITAERKLAAVGHLLQQRHGGKYMVWNLSEVEYDASILDDQVLIYKFPGSPSPPLGLLLKLLLSIESWLKADERNVAVLHCLTGRGRTSTVLAAFLCWTGEAGFRDVNVALEYIARCKRLPVEALTIPSQVRYVSYFANMLDGVRPSQPPLMLKRIIMSEAPKFGKRSPPSAESNNSNAPATQAEPLLGCAPYLQIFKAGNLIFTTAASTHYAQTKDDLPFVTIADGPISFLTEAVVQGDILLRCRHLTKNGQRVSMFRCAFHTGYVPPKVLRLTKAQLDGACGDKRFSEDFFLDLIFEPCDEATASQLLISGADAGNAGASGEGTGESGGEDAANEAAKRRSMGTVANASNTVSASAYDSMLHRDSRFWDVISARREENMKKMAEQEKSGEGPDSPDKEEKKLSLSGPTIGRRRDFQSAKQSGGSSSDGLVDESNNRSKAKNKQQQAMSAFSIGGDFDFGTETPKSSTSASSTAVVSPPSPPPTPKKKDELMEALMGLEDDGMDDDDENAIPSLPISAKTEEIIFESSELSKNVEESDGSAPKDQGYAVVDSGDANSAVPSRAPETDPPSDQKIQTSQQMEDTEESGIPTSADESNLPAVSDVKQDTALLDSAGLEDDLAELAVDAVGSDVLLDDVGDEYEDFDDLEDDAELEDLENFLTQVSTK